MLYTALLATLMVAINATPLMSSDSSASLEHTVIKRQGNTAVNLGEGSCANPTGTRGPVEGFGACNNIVDGCCTVDPNYTGGTYAWVVMLTSGSHGHIQAFSDPNCSEDASPVVTWNEGACVDANNSGKDIGSIRITS